MVSDMRISAFTRRQGNSHGHGPRRDEFHLRADQGASRGGTTLSLRRTPPGRGLLAAGLLHPAWTEDDGRAYRARLNRCDGRPTVPEDMVPVPRRWGSMARRKVSFCRVNPAMAS
jgi:hypothetical protein